MLVAHGQQVQKVCAWREWEVHTEEIRGCWLEEREQAHTVQLIQQLHVQAVQQCAFEDNRLHGNEERKQWAGFIWRGAHVMDEQRSSRRNVCHGWKHVVAEGEAHPAHTWLHASNKLKQRPNPVFISSRIQQMGVQQKKTAAGIGGPMDK
ncbi:hypothetical protein LR48_Vigan01g129100 [Vigna angularis]|uniref:Uncharacterized protein n=1 Tax=Phaseolus angularis TaxID=3914 RepID=A0A0L9TMQ0_PHAAN|nr:hypothetical protein LR48_Vigan01g129100 [Vigna angularis]